QIEELTGTSPVDWTPIGPTIVPQAGGETEHTLNGIFGAERLFHVLELDP
ncbi:MAG: hypothetical protein GWO24_05925, partial [Akkermansiaceae bacterium]|nr:hypothetical protein [Akkermansiaceae bacterium]